MLKSILKSLIFVCSNLNCYRHSVSILLIVEPLSAYSAQNENQRLDIVLPLFIFVFKFFYGYKNFLVHVIARLIWQ